MLRGFFKNNCPYIRITVVGSLDSREIDVLVDTGFNGYLTLPEQIAKELGLESTGVIGSSTIADGSSSPYMDFRGKVLCNDKRVVTDIEVQPNCKILLGMSLLKALGLNLFIDLDAERIELNQSQVNNHGLTPRGITTQTDGLLSQTTSLFDRYHHCLVA